nr:DUF1700 domain-containing protein [Leuconostoc mesenteroides]
MENYLAELEQLLHQLHHSDKEEAMNFYREYVMDADLVTYEQCISELGTPKQLSRKILADYSIKADEKSTDDTTSKNPRSNIKLIWWIGLALLASPLALPVFIVLVTCCCLFCSPSGFYCSCHCTEPDKYFISHYRSWRFAAINLDGAVLYWLWFAHIGHNVDNNTSWYWSLEVAN